MTREQIRQAVETAKERAELNGTYRNDCCPTCVHWEYEDGEVPEPGCNVDVLAWGSCHRYPPIQEGNDFIWPVAHYYDHCGEHKAVG